MTHEAFDDKITKLFQQGILSQKERGDFARVAELGNPLEGGRIPSGAELNQRLNDYLAERDAAPGKPQARSADTAPVTPAFDPAHTAAVMQAARAELDKVGLHQVGVQMHDSLAGGNLGDYHNGLIRLSADQSPASVSDTLHHEIVHGLRDNGAFTKAEWATLSNAATNHPEIGPSVDKAYPNLSPEARTEEKVAELVAKGWSKPQPSTFVGRMVQRVKSIVGAVGRALRKQPNADDIISQIKSGKIGNRQMAEPAARAQGVSSPQARRPMTPEAAADEGAKKTPSDILDAAGGTVRRVALNLSTMHQIAEVYAKTPIGPLLDRWADNLNMSVAKRETVIAQGAHVHADWLALPKDHQAAVGKALLDSTVSGKPAEKIVPGATPAEESAAKKVYDGAIKHFAAQRDQFIKFMSDQIRAGAGTDAEKASAIAAIEKRLSKQVYFPLMRFGDFINVGKNAAFEASLEKVEAAQAEVNRLAKATGTTTEQLAAAQEALKQANADHETSAASNYIVTAHESRSDQLAAAREMQAKGMTVNSLKAADYQPHLHGPSTAFTARYDEMLAADSAAHPERKAGNDGLSLMMHQLATTMAPEGAALRNALQRKNVAGYSEDAIRVFAAGSRRNAGFLAALENGERQRQILAQIDSHLAEARAKPGADTVKLTDVRNQVNKHYNVLQKYSQTPVQNFLSNMTYAYMLGGSPSFMAMHLMQTPMVTAPMLSAHFNPARVSGELGKAFAEVASQLGSLKEGKEGAFGKTPGEKAAVAYGSSQALWSTTHADQSLSAGDKTSMAGRIVDRIMGVAGLLPHYTEKLNRMGSFLAAYRMALDSPKIHGMLSDERYASMLKDSPELASLHADPKVNRQMVAAMKYAGKITLDSHVDYSRENAAYLMQPGVVPMGKLVFQFQKYQQAMIYSLVKNAGDSFSKNLTGYERWAARKTLLGVVGTHAMLTGAMGLPGYGVMALALNLFHKIAGDKDKPYEADDAFHQFLEEHLGKDAGDVVGRGLLYAPGIRDVLPADITDRLGMGDLGASAKALGGGQIDKNSVAQYIGTALGGPAASLLGQFADANNEHLQGDDWKAAELLMPKVARDISRAIRYAQQGVTTASSNPVVTREEMAGANPWTSPTLWMQALGFTPQKVESAYANKASVMDAKAELDARRKILLKQFTDATVAGDTDKTAALRDKINAYNDEQRSRGVYSELINGGEMMRSVQTRRLAQMRLANGISMTPKQRGLVDEYSLPSQ